ncbi:MAG: tRNA preQ1(34) S-adenosylmethionine ribosyltransferase-isomerase QueA [candidate division WOR-3 bacterium]
MVYKGQKNQEKEEVLGQVYNKEEKIDFSIDSYDYPLTPDFIAHYPLLKRDEAKLLVYNSVRDKIEHTKFKFIKKYFKRGDLLILNNTKVIPAKIFAKKESGGKVEILFLEKIDKNKFKALIKGKNVKDKKIYAGDYILKCYKEKDFYLCEIENGECRSLIKEEGFMPLPPYIKRKPEEIDKIYYQSVFAKKEGSIAAPTASLHFTKNLLEEIKEEGVRIAYINLKIGKGTFALVKEKDIRRWKMEEEYYEIPEKTIFEIEKIRKENGRIFVCGTTSVRALESYGLTKIKKGFTNLFIYPGFKFIFTDCIITNFHFPKSTNLILICAFAGREKVLNLYEIAKRENYRFLSYGDAMLIIKKD